MSGPIDQGSTHLYDKIGVGYRSLRVADPRIEAAIWSALGNANSVINVGAGAGSYEPPDRLVVAVEPSWSMIEQRPSNAAPAIQAMAERQPFADASFDAALAILTIQHWSDLSQGLRELARISANLIVFFTWDPSSAGFWLVQDYFPEILEIDRSIFPEISRIESILGDVNVLPVPIPGDCTDGFFGAYWKRPEAYLDARIRSGMSSFQKITNVDDGLNRLRRDLETGKWEQQYSYLLEQNELDIGYRLVVTQAKKEISH